MKWIKALISILLLIMMMACNEECPICEACETCEECIDCADLEDLNTINWRQYGAIGVKQDTAVYLL